MSPLTTFTFDVSVDDVLEAQGDALRRPGMSDVARKAFAAAEGLVSPQLVHDWYPVGEVQRRTAEIGGVKFELGRHADLISGAASAFVGLVTIGAALEEEARRWQGAGRALDAFMLGEVGVFYVGKLLEEAHHVAEREAAARGWGVGAELAPGQLAGWAIAEQKLLCGLLDIESAGVSVTDSGMLVPQKSASLVVGIGPEYTSTEVRSPCEYCDVRETCRFRH